MINESNREQLIFKLEGSLHLRIDDEIFPLVSLSEIMFQKDTVFNRSEFIIILAGTSYGKKYGIGVESINDFEDAVVKPVMPIVKSINIYAGATFLSNGQVGLLIDVDGLAHNAHIKETFHSNNADLINEEDGHASVSMDYLLFELNAPGLFAVRQDQLYRLEEFQNKELDHIGNQTLKEYRGKTMTFFDLSQFFVNEGNPSLEEVSRVGEFSNDEVNHTFVIYYKEHYYGFSVRKILDIVSTEDEMQTPIRPKPGLIGNTTANGKTIAVIDPIAMIESVSNSPDLTVDEKAAS